jgi:hypothetical protein
MMSTSPYECLFKTDCPYCLLGREIIAVKFPLFRPTTALFVCPSCGSALAARDGPTTKRDRLRHRGHYPSLIGGPPAASVQPDKNSPASTGASVSADVSPMAPARRP